MSRPSDVRVNHTVVFAPLIEKEWGLSLLSTSAGGKPADREREAMRL
jgi:hypothetical protein